MEYIIETKNLCKSYEKKAAVTSLNTVSYTHL